MTQTRALPPLVDLPALHAAARVLHDHFLKDVQSIPDLADLLPRPCSPPPSAPRSPPSSRRSSFLRVLQRLPRRLSRPLPETQARRHTRCPFSVLQ